MVAARRPPWHNVELLPVGINAARLGASDRTLNPSGNAKCSQLTLVPRPRSSATRTLNRPGFDGGSIPWEDGVLCPRLGRPVQFYEGDRLVVGEYGGYVGFPATQRRALHAEHPSWLFADSDQQTAMFRAECARRGITYRESRPGSGLVLFSRLSQPLTPSDLHLGGQLLEQV
jgi:hypothetical protein